MVLCIKEGRFFRHLFPGSSLTVPTHLKLTLPSTVKLHPGYDFTARRVGWWVPLRTHNHAYVVQTPMSRYLTVLELSTLPTQ